MKTLLLLTAICFQDASIQQHEGKWIVDCHIPTESKEIKLKDIEFHYKANLSNSACPGHAKPREYETQTDRDNCLVWAKQKDVNLNCMEGVYFEIDPDPLPKNGLRYPYFESKRNEWKESKIKNQKVHVRIWIFHHHKIFGEFHPLVGDRHLKINILGQQKEFNFKNHVHKIVTTNTELKKPDDSSLTKEFSHSPPESIVIRNYNPHNRYYFVSKIPVKYGEKIKISYWYLISPFANSQLRINFVEGSYTNTEWWEHKETKKWIKAEKIIQLSPTAEEIEISFRIESDDGGEVWIDDLRIEYVNPNLNRKINP